MIPILWSTSDVFTPTCGLLTSLRIISTFFGISTAFYGYFLFVLKLFIPSYEHWQCSPVIHLFFCFLQAIDLFCLFVRWADQSAMARRSCQLIYKYRAHITSLNMNRSERVSLTKTARGSSALLHPTLLHSTTGPTYISSDRPHPRPALPHTLVVFTHPSSALLLPLSALLHPPSDLPHLVLSMVYSAAFNS